MDQLERIANALERIAIALEGGALPVTEKPAEIRDADGVPEWFEVGIQALAGKCITATDAMATTGQPTDMRNLRLAGKWLRQLGYESRRSGGQILFRVKPKTTTGAAFDATRTPAERAIDYVKSLNDFRMTTQEIAQAISVDATKQNHYDIWAALNQAGVKYSSHEAVFYG